MTSWPRGLFRWLLFPLAFLILPNLPLVLAARSLSLLIRGYVDLDYLLISIVALFVPRAVTFALLFGAIVFDFTHAACITYLFAPSEFLNAVRFSGLLSTARVMNLAIALAFVLVVCFAIVLCVPRSLTLRQRQVASAAILAAFLLLGLNQWTQSTQWAHREGNRGLAATAAEPSSIGLTRTPTFDLLYSQVNYLRYSRSSRPGNQVAMPSASALALHHLNDFQAIGASPGHDTRPNLVLILLESWGLAQDASLRRALTAPYADPGLLAKYDVQQGTTPFGGPTPAGEARELCQVRGLVIGVGSDSPSQFERCVPMQLRSMGYRTLAVHGFFGEMFDRKVWYPQIGFEDIWFHDRLQALGMPNCPGPFWGICDAAIARWLESRLQQTADAPLFVHWVTLNSHLPVPVPAPLKSPVSCAISPATARDPAICSWYQLVSVAQQSVHDLALAPMSRPTIFVIVGDHQPPFDTQERRGQFSSAWVPYVILLPRSSTIAAR